MVSWLDSSYFLSNPDQPIFIFRNLECFIKTNSKARAAYWMGNALEEVGSSVKSQRWYEKASLYSLTFYGQLAASKLSEKKLFNPLLVEYSDANNTDYKENRPVFINLFLNEFDRPKLVKKFIWDLADRNNLSTSVNSVKTANDIGRHDFAVQAGKILYYNHTILDPLSFPQIERPEFGKLFFQNKV